eukprot:2231189-Prymnesium_polylepis.1
MLHTMPDPTYDRLIQLQAQQRPSNRTRAPPHHGARGTWLEGVTSACARAASGQRGQHPEAECAPASLLLPQDQTQLPNARVQRAHVLSTQRPSARRTQARAAAAEELDSVQKRFAARSDPPRPLVSAVSSVW